MIGRVILHRLTQWSMEQNILSDIQYGFHAGRGTVEQNLNLHLIINKYVQAKKGSLHLSFMGLSSAFDLVNREKL